MIIFILITFISLFAMVFRLILGGMALCDSFTWVRNTYTLMRRRLQTKTRPLFQYVVRYELMPASHGANISSVHHSRPSSLSCSLHCYIRLFRSNPLDPRSSCGQLHRHTSEQMHLQWHGTASRQRSSSSLR